MKDFLENIAIEEGWSSEYGRRDFTNLYDKKHEDSPVLLIDPIQTQDDIGPGGRVESVLHSGSFLLCLSSSFNEKDYSFRYENYIKPLIGPAATRIKNKILCVSSLELVSWSTVEVVNSDVFDFNFDGILVSFQVRKYAE